MIQGQFDAATKLDGVRSDDARTGDAERPRKRRRVSPSPVGDTIEVKDATEDIELPTEGESIEVMGQDESMMSNDSGCIEAVNPSDEEPCIKAESGDSDRVDPIDKDPEPDTDEEVVLLSEESVLAEESRGDSDLGLPSSETKEAHGKSDGGRPPAGVMFVNRKESVEQKQGRHAVLPESASATTSATFPSTLQQSSPPGHISTASRHHKPSISKALTIPLDPSSRIVSSSGPSTPKQSSSESGAQTTTVSSPLSSPPPLMSDPYEEQLANSHPSSSRCTSPDSSDDASPSYMQPFKSQALKHASLSTLKGRDLFDASIWSDPLKTSVFYTFATNLRQKSRFASPTGSHHFISHLRNSGKMVRCYTQNIDLLEDKVGLATHLVLGTGSRSRFSARNAKAAAAAAANSRQDLNNNEVQTAELEPTGRPTVPGGYSRPVLAAGDNSTQAPTSNHRRTVSDSVEEASVLNQEMCGDAQGLAKDSDQEGGARGQVCAGNGKKENAANSGNIPKVSEGGGASQSKASSPEPDRGVECVYLHGSLRALRCFQCGGVVDWDEADRELQTMSGQQPPCPRCEDATAARQERGKRALGVGKLRPDIVLYGEEHPESQQISDIIQHDLSLAPDMLIIMGTSLKVHGLKTVVKEFAKAVHNKKDGKVIFINYTKPADSVWADTIDFWVQMDCDAWVHDLKEKKPLIWLPPGSVTDESRNKRRRRTNNETEKVANKELTKVESINSTITMAPSSKPNKVQKKEAPKETKPTEPKPQPKRPAAFRDHKANGAFLTTKIMRDLAAISGRETPNDSPVSTTVKGVPKVEQSVPAAGKPFASKQGLRTGRGPRLKNARTRKPVSKVVTPTETITASSSIEEAITPKIERYEGGISHTRKRHANTVGVSGPAATPTYAHCPSLVEETKPSSDAKGADGLAVIKRKASPPTSAQDQSALAEMSIPNSGPDLVGGDNSILAAVKSHHRIRRPKSFFESQSIASPKSGRGTPVPSGGNTKSKAKPAPQGKKAKPSGKAAKVEQGRRAPQKQTPILPPPRPMVSTSTPAIRDTTTSEQPDVPIESFTLPPLHLQNLESYKYPTQYKEWPYTPAQPPAYLEPTVVVQGPPSDMSPTTSPQHWRKRSFSLIDPQSRNFQGPCRGLDFMAVPTVGPPAGPPDNANGVLPTLGPPPAQLTAQMIKINAAPPSASRSVVTNAPFLAPPQAGMADTQPPPGVQSVEDSPTRQLQRENEAAAALSQLRKPPVFDDRRFAMI